MKITSTLNNSVEIDLLKLNVYKDKLYHFFFYILLRDNIITIDHDQFTITEMRLYANIDNTIGIAFDLSYHDDNELVSFINHVPLSYWEELNSGWFNEVRSSDLLSSFTKSKCSI
jgi:hypothetical protein